MDSPYWTHECEICRVRIELFEQPTAACGAVLTLVRVTPHQGKPAEKRFTPVQDYLWHAIRKWLKDGNINRHDEVPFEVCTEGLGVLISKNIRKHYADK